MNSSTDIHRRERIHGLHPSHTRDYFTLGKNRKHYLGSLSPKNRYILPHSHRNQPFKSPSLFHKSHQPTHQPHSNNLTPYFPTLLPRTPQLLTINPSFPLHILHRIRIKPKFLSMRTVRYAAETNAEFRCICAVLF